MSKRLQRRTRLNCKVPRSKNLALHVKKNLRDAPYLHHAKMQSLAFKNCISRNILYRETQKVMEISYINKTTTNIWIQ